MLLKSLSRKLARRYARSHPRHIEGSDFDWERSYREDLSMISFVKGTPLRRDDLQKCHVRKAVAVVLLADAHSSFTGKVQILSLLLLLLLATTTTTTTTTTHTTSYFD